MQTYELLVQERAIRGNSENMALVRTSVGMDRVHVLFDSDEWLEFPVNITFAQGDDVVTVPVVLSGVDGSEWVAETECVIPHEVIDMIGSIRVTIQGTDSNGRHIITAKGSPLSVREAGDTDTGELPQDVPTIDQWNQAYSEAMTAAGNAQTLVNNLQQRIDAIVSSAESEIASLMSLGPATKNSLGTVRIGNGLSITEEGVLSSLAVNGITQQQATAIANLSKLAYLCFDTEFDNNGLLMDNAHIKAEQFPRASVSDLGTVMVDGTTVIIDDDGMIHSLGCMVAHRWDGTTLEITSESGTSSVDLKGERGERGEQGERGERGPAGYELTDGDIDAISDRIYERYLLGDDTRY